MTHYDISRAPTRIGVGELFVEVAHLAAAGLNPRLGLAHTDRPDAKPSLLYDFIDKL